MHAISNPTVALELARLRSEDIRRDVRGDDSHRDPSWSRRRPRRVR